MSKNPRRRRLSEPSRLEELTREVERRSRLLPGLYRRLANAQERVQRILASIRAMEGRGTVAAPGRRISRKPAAKPAREVNLVGVLAKLLKKKPMNPAEAAEGVRKAGYRSGAPDLLAAVTRALTESARFRRAGRGRFTSRD